MTKSINVSHRYIHVTHPNLCPTSNVNIVFEPMEVKKLINVMLMHC